MGGVFSRAFALLALASGASPVGDTDLVGAGRYHHANDVPRFYRGRSYAPRTSQRKRRLNTRRGGRSA